jgi:hypothetical protein
VTDPDSAGGASRRRSIPGASAAEEQLLAMVTALTAELSVTRERLDTLERLVEEAGVVSQAQIEDFAPGEAVVEAREGIRQRIIRKVFRPLRETAERDVARARQQDSEMAPAADDPRQDKELASQ